MRTLVCLLIPVLLGNGTPTEGAALYTHAAMGTEFQFILYGVPEDSAVIAREAFAIIDDLEARISSWRTDSQTARINNSAGIRPIRVSADLFQLLETSMAIHRKTNGAFDVTVGPLIDAWGIRNSEPPPSPPDNLKSALRLVGTNNLVLNAHEQTAYLKRSGMKLDFGAIGKGFALDQAARHLKQRGIEAARLSAGTSTILAIGAPPGRSGWKVHIGHPYNPEEPIDTLILHDEALSTSVCSGSKDDRHGTGPCDILDPRTGMPAHGVLSATAIGESAMGTDALSTAFLVMGVRETELYCRNYSGVRAIVLEDSHTGPFMSEKRTTIVE